MKGRYLLFLALVPVVCLLLAASLPDKVPLYVYRDDGRVAAPTQFLATVFQAGPGISILNNRTQVVISATGASNGVAVAPGLNVTVTTNAVGSTMVFTVAASLPGGGASLADVTNVVTSYTTPNATNVANDRIARAGDTMMGPLLSTASSASNAPAANELPTAQWVRSLFQNGYVFFYSTNHYGAATNPSDADIVLMLTNTIPPSSSHKHATVVNNEYLTTYVPTNAFTFLQGPLAMSVFIQASNGTGGPTTTVHPELYYSYDRTNWLGDWSGPNQTVATGTNLYGWVITFPAITSTNAAGFYIASVLKVGTATGGTHHDIYIHMGTNYLSGTNGASQMQLAGSSSAQIPAPVDGPLTLAGTNMAYASDLTWYGNRQWRGSVSNALSGNLNILWTNANTFGGASMVLTADGSDRTVYLFFEAGRTVRYCTNTVLAATNVVIPANESVNLLIGNYQTNGVKVGAVKMQ